MGRNAYYKQLRRSVIDWDRKVSLSLFYKLFALMPMVLCTILKVWCLGSCGPSLVTSSTRWSEYIKPLFTWRHSGHVGFLRHWNGGHVGVPNQSCGSRIFSYVNASFCCNNAYAYIDAGHVSENALFRHGSAENLWRHRSGRHAGHHNLNRQIKSNGFLNPQGKVLVCTSKCVI